MISSKQALKIFKKRKMKKNSKEFHLTDLSHRIESGMISYKGLPAPIICDFLSRENPSSTMAEAKRFR